MSLGVHHITINGADFATTDDIVFFDPAGSASQVMEILGYGAPAKVFLDLGNQSLPSKLSVTKYHADDSDAWDWYWTAAQTFTGVYDIEFTKTLADGTDRTYKLTGAKITITVEPPINITTITHVAYEGGIPTLES